jgi:hypothetical protein
MEREEEREKVLVPIRRREAIPKEELPEEPPEPGEAKVREIPRRWHIY